ncbi:MAG: SH3 domain-containing protein [Dehalococcoidia bacterium]|nr:SH3 domain-containing protein [Dehalococcoidia bacterium]
MAGSYKVATAGLNLRAAAGVGNPVLRVLREGELVTALDAEPAVVDGGTWVHVAASDGLRGWVNRAFLAEVAPAGPAQFRVTAEALNLREGPDPDTRSIAVLPRGLVVVAAGVAPVTLADGNTWMNVAAEDATVGWVNARFLAPAGEPDGGGGGELLAWGAKVSPAFRQRVREIAANLGFEPDLLMAVIAFESAGTFSASVRNPESGATGLIQFMPSTAEGMGTTVAQLAAMTAEEQLDWVERYLSPYRGKIRAVSDLYMSILWPGAVGQAEDFVLFSAGTVFYTQNAKLDKDLDGTVTKREAAAKVIAALEEGRRPGNVG